MSSDEEVRLRLEARALVDAITEDECGAMVGGKWMGGHGGLLSRNTLALADQVRRTIDDLDRADREQRA
jgi:hypothetical protein